MDFDDKVLFEQFFNISRTNGRHANNKILDFIINLLLNSKEFQDSNLRISDKKLESHLLSLSVKSITFSHDELTFYAMYYVSDGEVVDNRDIIGNITIKEGKAFLLSEIHSFILNKDVDLGEVFEMNFDGSYSRFSSYNIDSKNSIQIIDEEDFNKAPLFKEETLKLIKTGKRG